MPDKRSLYPTFDTTRLRVAGASQPRRASTRLSRKRSRELSRAFRSGSSPRSTNTATPTAASSRCREPGQTTICDTTPSPWRSGSPLSERLDSRWSSGAAQSNAYIQTIAIATGAGAAGSLSEPQRSWLFWRLTASFGGYSRCLWPDVAGRRSAEEDGQRQAECAEAVLYGVLVRRDLAHEPEDPCLGVGRDGERNVKASAGGRREGLSDRRLAAFELLFDDDRRERLGQRQRHPAGERDLRAKGLRRFQQEAPEELQVQRANLAHLGGVARGEAVADLRWRQRRGGGVLPVCLDGRGGDLLAFVQEDLHLLADEALRGAARDRDVAALDVDVVKHQPRP